MTNGNIFAAIQEMFKIRHYARKLKMPWNRITHASNLMKVFLSLAIVIKHYMILSAVLTVFNQGVLLFQNISLKPSLAGKMAKTKTSASGSELCKGVRDRVGSRWMTKPGRKGWQLSPKDHVWEHPPNGALCPSLPILWIHEMVFILHQLVRQANFLQEISWANMSSLSKRLHTIWEAPHHEKETEETW